jgi:membrane-associated phospholipid phosphatase
MDLVTAKRESGVLLPCQIQERLALTIMLAALVCMPARCQNIEHLSIQQPAEAPVSPADVSSCAPAASEVCSELSPVDLDPGQHPATDGKLKKTVSRFEKDQSGIYSAPFHRSALKWDAPFLASTGALIATDRHASRALSQDHINVSQTISDVGLYGTSAAAGAFLVAGLATHNEHARETGFLSAEALANTMPIYGALQFMAGRERPNEGTGNGRFRQNNALGSSFPSAHALFAWSMASVIAHEYPRPWVKWLTYGTALAVSVTRFSGREHFPSDVLVGSVIGYLVGRHIFNVRCKDGLSESCHPR